MELKDLIEAVDVQNSQFSELRIVLERETSQLTSIDTVAMSESDRAKEELINRISKSSSLLQKAVTETAVHEGLPADSSLGAIAKHFAALGSWALLGKQEELLGTVTRVRQLSEINREIAECFASSVASSLALITSLINQSSVYGATGSYQRRPSGAVLINREA